MSYNCIDFVSSNVAKIAKETADILAQFAAYAGIDTGNQIVINENFNYLDFVESKYFNNRSDILVGLPILYLEGDTTTMSKDNKVSLAYKFGSPVRGYTLGTCNCKWQGNSSIYFPKHNYTISKLSNPIDAGWGSHKKYVLKANYNDFSHALNVCCAKLWGQIVNSRTDESLITTRLQATPNGGAVDGFPIILVINNKYEGVYTFNIPKDDWLFGMGTSSTEGFLCAEGAANEVAAASVALKGLITKENLLQEQGFSIGYVPDEDSIDWILDGANNAISSLLNNPTALYGTAIEQFFDITSFMDHYIFTALIEDSDSVVNNWLFGTFDGVKFFCSAYDLDCSFGAKNTGSIFTGTVTYPFSGWAKRSNMYDHIFKYSRSKLKARYAEIRNSVMTEDNVLMIFTNFLNKIPIILQLEDAKVYSKRPNTNVEHLSYFMNWYRLHCIHLDARIASL